MYRYSGENTENNAPSTEQTPRKTLAQFIKTYVHFYPDYGKWRKISLSFDEQLAKYGEVEKDLFF